MARKPKPYYRKDRNVWECTIGGERHMWKHPEDGPKPKKGKTGWHPPLSITKKFNALLGKQPVSLDSDSVAAILDDFLEWTQENRKPKTYTCYRDFCQSFIDEHGHLPISELNTGHVTSWISKKDTWNPTTKHDAITAINRSLNWAVRNRGLPFNPIRGMEKPTPLRRTSLVTDEEFEDLLKLIPDQEFKDLLVVSFDTGARPQEVKELLAEQIEGEHRRAVITEGKGGFVRAVYFPTARSWKTIERLRKVHPTGLLFLNTKGNPWTGYAVKCRFANLDKKVGRRIKQYDLRRGRITDWLKSGMDSHTAAQLSGHKNTEMLDKHYSRIADDPQYMLGIAKKAASASNGKASKKKASAKQNGKKKRTRKDRSPKS